MLISEIALQLGSLPGSTISKNYVFKQKSKNEKQKKVFQKWNKFELEMKSVWISPEVFCEKAVVINFAKFTGNTCARASLLIRLQVAPETLLKKRL